MQVTQADTHPSRAGSPEGLSTFRSSPNFLNMKKIWKSRSNIEQTQKDGFETEKPSEQSAEVKPAAFQPPLPTYPPPPDSPVVIKQEKEDIEEETPLEEPVMNGTSNGEVLHEPEVVVKEDTPRRTMCKEWFRGDCKRPNCRFAHVLIKTQLRGVYTFCWNYQNARCAHPNCKFVHASIFEEAEFYRTAILPPRARSHLKKPPVFPPEDHSSTFTNPPPQTPALTTNTVEKKGMSLVVADFANNMPPRATSPPKREWNSIAEYHSATFINPPPQTPALTTNTVEKKGMSLVVADFANNMPPRATSPPKREWNSIDEFSSSPRDLDTPDSISKKCKNCGILNFRLQINKEQVDSLIQTTEEIKQKNNVLAKKCSQLNHILDTLMNTTNNISLNGDKDENMIMSNLRAKLLFAASGRDVGYF